MGRFDFSLISKFFVTSTILNEHIGVKIVATKEFKKNKTIKKPKIRQLWKDT